MKSGLFLLGFLFGGGFGSILAYAAFYLRHVKPKQCQHWNRFSEALCKGRSSTFCVDRLCPTHCQLIHVDGCLIHPSQTRSRVNA